MPGKGSIPQGGPGCALAMSLLAIAICFPAILAAEQFPQEFTGPAIESVSLIGVPESSRSLYSIESSVELEPAVAGLAPPGTPVYNNQPSGRTIWFAQGPAFFLADDFSLTEPFGCDMVSYELAVVGRGGGTFDVHVELWNGDPCFGGRPLLTTVGDWSGLVADGSTVHTLVREFPDPPGIPGNVWMQVKFSSSQAGWVFAEQAEIGYTADFISSDGPRQNDCRLYFFGGPPFPYAGFQATIRCDLEPRLPGACCIHRTCSSRLERDCPGTWRGPLTGCTPNPCAEEIVLYRNSFDTGTFLRLNVGTKTADDLRLTPGPLPCHLATYEIVVAGEAGTAPFDAVIELWSNDRGRDGLESSDDLPREPIPGTRQTFLGLPADQKAHSLTAGPFEKGTLITEKVWVVLTTSSPDAGPLTAGLGDVGVSEDRYAAMSGTGWTGGLTFGGFNPADCPGGPRCVPAGSFRAELVCYGESASGACCDAATETCTDAVLIRLCDGRWENGVACSTQPFESPCPAITCPRDGELTFVDPPSGVVDARRPHLDNGSGEEAAGIQRVRVTAPPHADAGCFKLCETVMEPNEPDNDLSTVTEMEPGVYEFLLLRAITTGAVTSVTYRGSADAGRLVSHPGNVNADGIVDAADADALVNCFLGEAAANTCAYGFPYSQDIDHDGDAGPLDLTALIDLLNGAGNRTVWHGTPIPNGDCP